MKKTMILTALALALVFCIMLVSGCASTPMAAGPDKTSDRPSQGAVQGAITAKTAMMAAEAAIETEQLMDAAAEQRAAEEQAMLNASHILGADTAATIG